jgi:hypothetical protein
MAREYEVEVNLTIRFTASGQTQAEERTQTLDDAIGQALGKLKYRWVGDIDQATAEPEEVEVDNS